MTVKWQFTPHSLDAWNESDRRILFVAAEPNGAQSNVCPDMGAWFRTALVSSFLNNKQFYDRARITLSGMMGRDDDDIFDHFRFFILKATRGVSEANVKVVRDYVRENLEVFTQSGSRTVL